MSRFGPAACLLLGLAVGVLLGRFSEHRGRRRSPADRLAAELALSPEQKAAVEKAMEARRARFESMKAEARAEIRRLLTPAQAARFDELEARRPRKRGSEKSRK